MTDPVVIFRTNSDVEAKVVRGLLETHGIPAMMSAEALRMIFPTPATGQGDVPLSVPGGAGRRGASDHREPSRRGAAGRAGRASARRVRAAGGAHPLPLPRSRAARTCADAHLPRARGRDWWRGGQRVPGVPGRRGAGARHRRRALSRVSPARRRTEVEDQGVARLRHAPLEARRRAGPRTPISCSAAAKRRPAAGARRHCSPTRARR